MRKRRHDDGSVHTLESIAVAAVMVSSVAFVVTYQGPGPGTGGARNALQERVQDVLAVLDDTPVQDSALGDDELSVGILQCLQGACERLASRIDRHMPPGARYAVYLSNGEALLPVLVPDEPAGEAITHRRLMEPAWSYQFMAPAQSMVDPLADPLVVYALPVFSGSVVQVGGSALSIVAEGERASDGARFVLRAAASTRAVAPADQPSAAGISVWFHDGGGAPLAARDVTDASVVAPGVPSNAPVPFRVRLEESGGGVLPEGALLSVALPRGWKGAASQAANDAHWLVLSNATDANASAASSSILAKLRAPVTRGHVDLAFEATYVGSADDHATFTATLSQGAYARASLLVRGDEHVARSPYELPLVATSVPRPLGAGATTTWTLAAYSPEPVELTRIEVREEGGRPIFAGVASVSGPGAWTSEGDALVWTGSTMVSHEAPLALAFRVTSVSASGPALERAPFAPAVAFEAHTATLPHETAPGLYRGVFAPGTPAARGYDASFEGLRTTHALESASVHRAIALPGSADYAVGAGVALASPLLGSEVLVARREVAPGGTVDVAVEMQSLVYRLAALGLEPSVTLKVHPPWARDRHAPLVEMPLYDGTLAKGAGSFLAHVDTDGDLVPDADVGRLRAQVGVPREWLYGPYVVEAEVTWLERIEALPASENVLRSASAFDYFVVRPAHGELPASPVYDVHLLTWFADWG